MISSTGLQLIRRILNLLGFLFSFGNGDIYTDRKRRELSTSAQTRHWAGILQDEDTNRIK